MLEMPDVALDRPEDKGPLRAAWTVNRTNCIYLNGVSEQCAGPMSLQVVDLPRLKPGVAQGLTEHLTLRVAVGDRQATRLAVVVDGSAANHRQHPIAVTLSVRQSLEHDDTAALATAIAVRRCVKRFAGTVRGQGVHRAQPGHNLRGQHEAHACRQGSAALATS